MSLEDLLLIRGAADAIRDAVGRCTASNRDDLNVMRAATTSTPDAAAGPAAPFAALAAMRAAATPAPPGPDGASIKIRTSTPDYVIAVISIPTQWMSGGSIRLAPQETSDHKYVLQVQISKPMAGFDVRPDHAATGLPGAP